MEEKKELQEEQQPAEQSAETVAAPEENPPQEEPQEPEQQESEAQETQTEVAEKEEPRYTADGTMIVGDVDIEEEESYTKEEIEGMNQIYNDSFRQINENTIIQGKVIQIGSSEVVVDIGFKSEGIIPIDEFRPDELEALKKGDEVDIYLDNIENKDGIIALSKKKADFFKVWDKIKDEFEKGSIIDGYISKRIKGGMVAKIYNVEAFLPGSQIDIKQVTDFDQWVGQTIPIKIIKVNKTRRNIVVSRRVVLEDEREKKRKEMLNNLEKGMIVDGLVKNITDFGVFIDLGGVDGLLHITDMSWGRINHPNEMVKIGDRIKVKVIEYDRTKHRVSLGLKQLEPYPWEKVEEKYPIGSKIEGKVVSITDYGAFIELEKGIEGLIHISEMSWTQHVKHPSHMLKEGEEVEAIVLSVNKDDEKISLGLKQITPDPWEVAVEKYPINTKLNGKIKNLTNFGAFIEIEEGVEGLVHISDISWTKRIRHPNELLNRNDQIDVIVLGLDKENRRISLGIKQLYDDPWKTHSQEFAVDTEKVGKIRKVLEKGLIIDLEHELEGFVPVSQIGHMNIKKPSDLFFDGMELPMKVIELDNDNRRIVLSVKAYFEAHPEEYDEFMEKYSKKPEETNEEDEEEKNEPAADEPQEKEATPEEASEETNEETTEQKTDTE